MATATTETTIADLLESLGGIPARRVLFNPVPGTATERDLIEIHDRSNRLYELVDGTLVEKAMGFDESLLGFFLGGALLDYLKAHDLGKPVGADAMMRLFPGLVRIPDVGLHLVGALSQEEAAARGDPDARPRPGRRGAQQGQYPQGDGAEAPRILQGRRPAGLVRRPQQADRSGLHGRGSLDLAR